MFTHIEFEIEHLIPIARGGTDDEANLWLSCRACNGFKGVQTHVHDPQTNLLIPLFNPRTQEWHDHFMWSQDGTVIIGKTDCGRATIAALHLNNNIAINVRRLWVSVGWHPPKD